MKFNETEVVEVNSAVVVDVAMDIEVVDIEVTATVVAGVAGVAGWPILCSLIAKGGLFASHANRI